MSKNYTYLLLGLGYSFCDDYAPDGWEYFYEGDYEGWRSEADSDIEKDAKDVHREYGGQFTVEHTTPVRVGSKAALLKYAKQFAYNHPEGTRIIQVQVEGEEEIGKGQLRERAPSPRMSPPMFENVVSEAFSYSPEDIQEFAKGAISLEGLLPHAFELSVSYSPCGSYFWEIKDFGRKYQRSDAFDSEAEARIDGERQLKWLQENS